MSLKFGRPFPAILDAADSYGLQFPQHLRHRRTDFGKVGQSQILSREKKRTVGRFRIVGIHKGHPETIANRFLCDFDTEFNKCKTQHLHV